ncbi:hypothetical protein BJY59DRAFT_698522 [Rhodotorula toruloides]
MSEASPPLHLTFLLLLLLTLFLLPPSPLGCCLVNRVDETALCRPSRTETQRRRGRARASPLSLSLSLFPPSELIWDVTTDVGVGRASMGRRRLAPCARQGAAECRASHPLSPSLWLSSYGREGAEECCGTQNATQQGVHLDELSSSSSEQNQSSAGEQSSNTSSGAQKS